MLHRAQPIVGVRLAGYREKVLKLLAQVNFEMYSYNVGNVIFSSVLIFTKYNVLDLFDALILKMSIFG